MKSSKIKELNSIMEELVIVQKELVESKKNFITSVAYKLKLSNGMVITREKILKNGGDGSAAIILPVTEDGKVILTVEPRVFTTRSVLVGLPAGYIEKEEIPKEAALRELKEELGIEVNRVVNLGGFYQDTGCSSAYNHSFLGFGAKKVCVPSFDSGEIVSSFTCTFDEALELIEEGYIAGSNEIITLERAKKYLRRV